MPKSARFTPSQRKLLRWFDEHQRDVPWRKNRDPYAIWVSEVMLQQTLVATVVTYFERFLKRFPTIQSLAEAGEQEVLAHWQGLGYYRRARHLHAAAQQVCTEYAGVIPQDVERFRRLPGVGRYIAHAVLSQAFEAPLGVVEANTKRLYARLAGHRLPLSTVKEQNWLWDYAAEQLPPQRIGDWNQALMELGALVCKPVPMCERCPLAGDCQARKLGLENEIPLLGQKVTAEELQHKIVIVWSPTGDQLFLRKRSADGWWANFWEFPNVGLLDVPQPELTQLLQQKYVAEAERIAEFRYGITRYKVHAEVYLLKLKVRPSASLFVEADNGWQWVTAGELKEYPLSSPMRKAWGLVQKQLRQPSLFE